MLDAGVALDVISFSAAMSACEQGEQWQQALSLLRERSVVKLESDIMSYTTWQPAMSPLSEMWVVKLKPSIMSHSPTTSACEKRRRLQPALPLLSEMWVVTLEPDIMISRTLLDRS